MKVESLLQREGRGPIERTGPIPLPGRRPHHASGRRGAAAGRLSRATVLLAMAALAAALGAVGMAVAAWLSSGPAVSAHTGAVAIPDGPELVVLLDADGAAIGTAPKAEVHHADTPLHLAFSCYLVDDAGRLVMTRRATTKRTFPGVWTNSFCGHPAPGEALDEAVRRRGRQELGVEVGPPRLVLPRFRYRAEQDGVVEREMCPVFTAHVTGEPAPDPAEVEDVRPVAWDDLVAAVRGEAWAGLSPWCVEQVTELAALGAAPGDWPAGDPAALPPAAHLTA